MSTTRETLSTLMTLIDNNADQLKEGEYLAICNFMKASFERMNHVNVLEQLGIDYADSDSDSDDDYADDEANEMPEWDELDYDPNGTSCKDSRGNLIKAGDYIRMRGSGPNYTPELVTRVFFLGFEDRSIVHRDGWDDCGWKIDTDDGWTDLEEVIKVNPPTPTP